MIISFTGAQSVGKSTLLKALKADEEFKDWKFEPEITRKLKKKYKLDINEQGNSQTQCLIINSHLENILKHKSNNVILDRCIIDGLVYTTYLKLTEKVDTDVYLYSKYMFDNLIYEYDIIFYIEPEFDIVDDGVRSTDVGFRDTIAKLMHECIYNRFYPLRNVIMISGTVEERIAQVKEAIKKLKEKRNKL